MKTRFAAVAALFAARFGEGAAPSNLQLVRANATEDSAAILQPSQQQTTAARGADLIRKWSHSRDHAPTRTIRTGTTHQSSRMPTVQQVPVQPTHSSVHDDLVDIRASVPSEEAQRLHDLMRTMREASSAGLSSDAGMATYSEQPAASASRGAEELEQWHNRHEKKPLFKVALPTPDLRQPSHFSSDLARKVDVSVHDMPPVSVKDLDVSVRTPAALAAHEAMHALQSTQADEQLPSAVLDGAASADISVQRSEATLRGADELKRWTEKRHHK